MKKVKRKILKRSGSLVDFDKDILVRSLSRSGATNNLAQAIATDVEKGIKDGDQTSNIYKKAFEILYEKEKKAAMRYSLKKALFGFGPTGFPFEKFVAEIFKESGYSATTNVILNGDCINHEVDVLAIDQSTKERVAIEVKFHNDMNIRSDVKVVLYVKSRFDDLMGKTNKKMFSRKKNIDRCMLITNTKFTKSALKYGRCAGVDLMGWGYPYNNNLQTYIQRTSAHPITCLPSISQSATKELFNKGIVTCKKLMENDSVLRSLKNSDIILEEAKMLCIPFEK